MSWKYYIIGKLSGFCEVAQNVRCCNSLIKALFILIYFRLKYPIVDFIIRNGYKTCEYCELDTGEYNIACYKKGEEN